MKNFTREERYAWKDMLLCLHACVPVKRVFQVLSWNISIAVFCDPRPRQGGDSVVFVSSYLFAAMLSVETKIKLYCVISVLTYCCYYCCCYYYYYLKTKKKSKKKTTEKHRGPKTGILKITYLGTGVEKAIKSEVCCSTCHRRQTHPLATHLFQKSRIKVSMFLHIQWSRFKYSAAFLLSVLISLWL